MRLKVSLITRSLSSIPFNYQYQLHSAIYSLLKKSSKKYSAFLHDTGFIENNKHFKLFTFSKLKFYPYNITEKGFKNIKKIEFFFSTPVSKSFEHLVLGIFSDQKMILRFNGEEKYFEITNVETLPEPVFKSEMKFTCLSPIAMSTMQKRNEKLTQHYLDYMNPEEREHFIDNIFKNLKRKYKLVNNEKFSGNENFEFHFDIDYIAKRNGKISKLIQFKYSMIKAMEAPFTIKAEPDLIKIGYECGFGDKNSEGFGMVEIVEKLIRR